MYCDKYWKKNPSNNPANEETTDTNVHTFETMNSTQAAILTPHGMLDYEELLSLFAMDWPAFTGKPRQGTETFVKCAMCGKRKRMYS